MTNWRLYDVGATTYHTLVDFEIKNKLRGLNVVKGALLHNVNLADDTLVEIYDPNSTKVFTGFTKKVTKPSDTTLNKYDITERVVELADYLCESGGSYVYTYTNDNVNTIIDDILTGTGWTRGSSDAAVLDYVSLAYAKKLNALFYILRDQREHEVWFNNATKTVYFGAFRTDRSSTNISYIRKEDKSVALKHNVDKVIVLGSSANIIGEAGSSGKIAAFQYHEAATGSECARIATQLLGELGSSKVSEKVYLAPIVLYEEGDKIKVDGTVYVVFNISIKIDRTILVVGSTEETILDSFDGKLREVTGSIIVGENSVSSFDGGEQNIGTTVLARYRVQVDDVSLVNNFKLVGKLGNWKKSLSTGLEGTGLGVDQDYALPNNIPNMTGLWINTDWALPDNDPNDTGLHVDNDTDIPINTFNVYVKNSSDPLNWVSSDLPFNSGFSSFAFTSAHGSVTIEAVSADESVYLGLDYKIGTTWYVAGQTQTVIVKQGTRMTIPISALGPGNISSGSQIWRMKATSSSGNGNALNASLYCGFVGRHDHSTTENDHDHNAIDLGHDHNSTESDHDHVVSDAGHDHNTTEADHGHPETDNMNEINNYPADIVIKVNGIIVGTWLSAIHDQVLTVSDIKTHLNTGLNEITVESTKAASIYLGGEAEMVLIQ